MHATQVKRSTTSVTLNSPEILQAVATLFRLQVANPGRDVRLTFLTTAAVGAERAAPLSSGKAGLTAWHQAAKAGDVEEIRAALLVRLGPSPLSRFIRVASKSALRSRLLRALTFVCGQGDWQAIERKNRAALVTLRDEVQATAEMANRAYDAVFGQIVATIIDSDTRLLDRAALLDCLQAATAIAVPSQVVTKQLLSSRKAADALLPLNLEATPSAEGLLRFSPHNSRVPFIGRAAEVGALRKFIDAKADFSWWMLTGDGGMGKTRLARQLCVMLSANGWRAGFLPLHYSVSLEVMVGRWEPSVPTLIVVDYALQRTEDARALITTFARSSRSSCPIRILLLERDVEMNFEQEVLGYDQSNRAFILNTRYDAKPMHLRRLSNAEIWSLVQNCPWRADNRRIDLSATQFVTRLRAVDTTARPLVAMILADSIAEGSRRVGSRLECHLQELIHRERQMFWPARLGVSGKPMGATEADEIIALATLTSGFGKARLRAIAKARGRPFDTTLFPLCAQAIGKPFSCTRRQLERLEPDLIGELFALEVLGYQVGNPMVEPPRAWMPIAAWKVDGSAVADFVRRCEQNFPDHPALRSLRITVRGSADSWWSRAQSLAVRDYPAALEMLAKPATMDVGAAVAFGRMIYMLSSMKSRDRGVHQLALLNLAALLSRLYARNTALPRLWSASVVNFSEVYSATNAEACKDLVEKLFVLARKRRDPSVASDLVRATMHLIKAVRPRSSALRMMKRALVLAVPMLEDPTSVAVWSVALDITKEKLRELTAAEKRVSSGRRR